ncbi:MAG: hypothetical protein KGS09_19500 [Nitrospirae bacterium]|nr:hypothetical protein [Nitrospirota bacterium]MBU6482713.1 hypothetical protein [Nitrospirota bacterium]MDE3042706.1 hypothetical protein [Nitrospirota bacterium]
MANLFELVVFSKTYSFIGALLLIASSSYAADAVWLGSYKGSNIPGHEIVETEMLTSTFYGLQHEGVYNELLEHMKTQCVRDKGIALVNVAMMPAVGDIKMPAGNPGQAKIVSPGLHLGGLADCVLKIK